MPAGFRARGPLPRTCGGEYNQGRQVLAGGLGPDQVALEELGPARNPVSEVAKRRRLPTTTSSNQLPEVVELVTEWLDQGLLTDPTS